MTAMHAHGRRFVERVERERQQREQWELDAVRYRWDHLSERDRAILLATYYDDVVIPSEPPRRRWWQR